MQRHLEKLNNVLSIQQKWLQILLLLAIVVKHIFNTMRTNHPKSLEYETSNQKPQT